MLKKISVIIMVLILSACASQPAENGFKGPNDFDKVEAAKTRVSLGLTYLKNGSFSQAKFNLDRALEFDPRSGQANYAMAFYYQQVDEIKRAHEYYKQAIDYSRNDPDILNSYGAFLCKQGDYSQAKRYFLQAVDDKRYISTAQTYENLATCAQSQGLLDEAIAYFQSALNHQPTRATSLLYLSQILVQTGQWDSAKKTLWKYERTASVTQESLWLSFQIARGQKDLRAAVEHAERMKSLYPTNPNTQKALAALGKFQPDMAVTQKHRDLGNDMPPTAIITMADIAADNAQTNSFLTSALPTRTLPASNSSARTLQASSSQTASTQAAQTPATTTPATTTPATTTEAVPAQATPTEAALTKAALAQANAQQLTEFQTSPAQPKAALLNRPVASNAIDNVASKIYQPNVSLGSQVTQDTQEIEATPAPLLAADKLIAEAQGIAEAQKSATNTATNTATVDKTDLAIQTALNTADAETNLEITEALIGTPESPIVAEPGANQINTDIPFHVVLPKENLYRISLKYNVKIKKLLEWNNLQDASSIRIGTKLWLRNPN